MLKIKQKKFLFHPGVQTWRRHFVLYYIFYDCSDYDHSVLPAHFREYEAMQRCSMKVFNFLGCFLFLFIFSLFSSILQRRYQPDFAVL